MNRKNEFEKLDDRKKGHYRTVDDDTIINLKNYYKLEDHGELSRFIKDAVIIGDEG